MIGKKQQQGIHIIDRRRIVGGYSKGKKRRRGVDNIISGWVGQGTRVSLVLLEPITREGFCRQASTQSASGVVQQQPRIHVAPRRYSSQPTRSTVRTYVRPSTFFSSFLFLVNSMPIR